MLRRGSSSTTGLVLFIVGLVIGAGIVFAATFSNGGPTKTTTGYTTIVFAATTTISVVSTSIAFSTVTVTSGSPPAARVQASLTSCTWNGTNEVCQVVLTNSGNADSATTGSCGLTYGRVPYGGYSAATAAAAAASPGPQTLGAGTSTPTYCVAGTTQPTAGAQITGSISLINGGMALFSGTAS